MPPRSTTRRSRHRKVHVSLPAELYERVEAKSRLVDAPFSTTLAELVRWGFEREDQARLEEALRLDAEASAAFARRVGVVTPRVAGPSEPSA